MQIRLTTFNVENLFNRYAYLDLPWEGRSYEKFVLATGLASIASRQGDLVSYPTTEIQRNNTAQAILDSRPDILTVQEIENIYTLRNFNDQYLDDYFDRMIAIDGNDPRGIDVGLLIKKGCSADVVNVRTHVDEGQDGKSVTRSADAAWGYRVFNALFSRDCLEVDLKVNKKFITLLVNHLKAQDGTAASVKRRTVQAKRVAEIAKAAADESRSPIVIGDLNVDPTVNKGDKSLDSLLKSSALKDPFPAGTWTHYYTSERKISRLDYILPHKSLKVVGTDIVRKGLTTKCQQYSGPRYPTVGQEHTEASDHCPTTVVIEI
jgi:endonuclease/exonuclease/phosphatase family metal-dependent hydrolase